MDASIVVPTHNRSDVLLETLASLCRLDYPADLWEAVVVDDASTDDTPTVVPRWVEETDAPVRYLRQSHAGPAAARNRGASAAAGRVLVIIDNDILVEPDFLASHLRALAENPGCWILGRIVHPPVIRGTPFGRFRDDLLESFHRSLPHDGFSEVEGMSAANVSIPAEDFRRLGGFDERYTIASGEDWDLAYRARQAGIRVLYHPGLAVIHQDWAVDLDKFCHRQRLYGQSDVLLWRKFGDSCPKATMIRENGYIDWKSNPLPLIAKKSIKRFLASEVPSRAVRDACRVMERLAPDSSWSHRAYRAAVSLAIFQGVREGLAESCGARPYLTGLAPCRGPRQGDPR